MAIENFGCHFLLKNKFVICNYVYLPINKINNYEFYSIKIRRM